MHSLCISETLVYMIGFDDLWIVQCVISTVKEMSVNDKV
jgi:hypothetical protein